MGWSFQLPQRTMVPQPSTMHEEVSQYCTILPPFCSTVYLTTMTITLIGRNRNENKTKKRSALSDKIAQKNHNRFNSKRATIHNTLGTVGAAVEGAIAPSAAIKSDSANKPL